MNFTDPKTVLLKKQQQKRRFTIISMYLAGEPRNVIAKHFNITRQRVHAILKKAGIK